MGLLKEKLLNSLTKREAAGFVELLRKMKRPFGDNKIFLMSVDTKELFGILHHRLFGKWDFTPSGFIKVMKNLGEVKRILGEISPKTGLVEASNKIPLMPRRLQIENEEAGKVFVTIHAWKRFYERYCPGSKDLKQEEVIARLQRSFANARQVCLEGSYGVLRAMKNEFTPVKYFLNREIHCRFVVSLEKDESCLLTVERPFPKTFRKNFRKRKR